MINLTDSDKALITDKSNSGKAINLSTGRYYAKSSNKAYALKELIGERIATKVFELKCPEYYAITINDDYYVLSKDLNLEGKFLTLDKLGFKEDNNSLYDAWNILEQKYGKSFNEILDFIKIYIFDVLFHNLDRNEENLGILFSLDGNRKVVIFDNELMLSNDTKSEDYIDSRDYLGLHTDLEKHLNIYKDFERFLLESSPEFVLLFKHYMGIITPEYFSDLVKEVALQNNIDIAALSGVYPSLDETLSKLYTANYSRLQLILENLERKKTNAR